MAAFQIGDVILGKYEVTQVLGQGGMGIVFAARHRELDAPVALKFLLPSLRESPQSAERFAAEARTAMRLKSEHVVRVYDVATVDGSPFIVMEYLTGQDLSKVIAARGRLPVAEAVDLLLQACEAIAEAHNLGIVHRDLKPANVFVTAGSDELPFVKVLDFGISKSAAHPSVTATAAAVGSPQYMSPEQLAASRSVGPRADVWALGVMLYEMLTGTTPFTGESVALISAAILHGAYPKLSTRRADLPPELEDAVDDALQVDPEERLPSVEALAARIAPFGTETARAGYERIRRIAARRPAATPGSGEIAGAADAVERSPASPAAPAPASETAPPHGTRPAPAVRASEASGPRRRRWRTAAVAAAIGLPTLGLGLVGWQARPWSLASTTAPPASGVFGPTGPTDAASERDARVDGGARWQASLIEMDGLGLGDFVHASFSSPSHPQGTLAAVGDEYDSDAGQWNVYAVSIDVGTGRAFARVPLGLSDGGVFISAAPAGAIFAVQRDKTLDLVPIDAERGILGGDPIVLPGFGKSSPSDLRGMAMFGDRIVLASGGDDTTTLRILDEHGKLLTRHDCHAGLFRPSRAGLARVGDDVIVTNFYSEDRRVPICAGQLHGTPRWRELKLSEGSLLNFGGVIYFQGFDGAVLAPPRALDSNLQPTGPDPLGDRDDSDDECAGLTGMALGHEEKIHNRLFVYMTSCCAGPPGGLFVCRPRSEMGQ